MAKRTNTLDITIDDKGGTFDFSFNKFTGKKQDYDFEGIAALRKILSNERARMLHVIKYKKPKSLYELAKILERDFKSVSEDVKLLERFGFIDMISEKTGKRERLKPVLILDMITIRIRL